MFGGLWFLEATFVTFGCESQFSLLSNMKAFWRKAQRKKGLFSLTPGYASQLALQVPGDQLWLAPLCALNELNLHPY